MVCTVATLVVKHLELLPVATSTLLKTTPIHVHLGVAIVAQAAFPVLSVWHPPARDSLVQAFLKAALAAESLLLLVRLARTARRAASLVEAVLPLLVCLAVAVWGVAMVAEAALLLVWSVVAEDTAPVAAIPQSSATYVVNGSQAIFI